MNSLTAAFLTSWRCAIPLVAVIAMLLTSPGAVYAGGRPVAFGVFPPGLNMQPQAPKPTKPLHPIPTKR
jgi:hypothetical protein